MESSCNQKWEVRRFYIQIKTTDSISKKTYQFFYMKFKKKYLITVIVLLSFSSIFYGFHIKDNDELKGNKFIGAGTVGLFLVAMPLFLLKESKGKKMKDYMLNRENIEKMQAKEAENKKKP